MARKITPSLAGEGEVCTRESEGILLQAQLNSSEVVRIYREEHFWPPGLSTVEIARAEA
jgi:hypothetical protein